MSVKLIFDVKEKLDVKDSIAHSVNDLSLDVTLNYPVGTPSLLNKVNSSVGVREDSFIIQMDTISICFTDRRLASIDAYTNKSNWKLSKIDIPEDVSIAICNIEYKEDDDRTSISVTPLYIFDEDRSLLQIQLVRSEAEVFWQIADNVILGVSNGQISSLFIKNLVIV